MAPLVAAAPYISVASSVMQFTQQGAIGKYNQRNAERNAAVAEQEAIQIGKQTEFDIAMFDKQFRQTVGSAQVAVAKSGAVSGSGTAARIAMSNAIEAQLERNVMNYNGNIAQSRKREEAQFSRISGQMARQQARLAQISTIANTGTSLLKMGSPKTKTPYQTSNSVGPGGRFGRQMLKGGRGTRY